MTSMTDTHRHHTNKKPQIEVLHALRGLSAFVVWVDHANSWQFKWFGTGRMAMTTFFILSGFLMVFTTSSCDLWNRKCRFNFYLKRVARIVPLFYVNLIMNYKDIHCVWEKTCTVNEKWVIGLAPFFLKSWVPDPTLAWLWGSVTWSLNVEMFCYFLVPFLTPVVRHRKYRWFFILLCVITTVVPQLVITNLMVYVHPLARAPEFILGMFMCVIFLEFNSNELTFEDWCRRRNIVSKVLLYFLANIPLLTLTAWAWTMPFVFSEPEKMGSPITIIMCLWMFSLLWTKQYNLFHWILTGFLGKPWFYLGEISYAFYLIHIFIMLRLSYHWSSWEAARFDPFFQLVALTSAIGLACVLHFLLENPLYQAITTKYLWKPCHDNSVVEPLIEVSHNEMEAVGRKEPEGTKDTLENALV